MGCPLVILTGASGSGKTTLARYVQEHHPDTQKVVFFDSIGVPPVEQLTKEYGSGEAWQRAMTLHWMAKIGKILATGRPMLFEGQMRIAFIQQALADAAIENARIILVDCDDSTRRARLQINRKQPELANPRLLNWARYLREEARSNGIEILDTGRVPLCECVNQICRWLEVGNHLPRLGPSGRVLR